VGGKKEEEEEKYTLMGVNVVKDSLIPVSCKSSKVEEFEEVEPTRFTLGNDASYITFLECKVKTLTSENELLKNKLKNNKEGVQGRSIFIEEEEDIKKGGNTIFINRNSKSEIIITNHELNEKSDNRKTKIRIIKTPPEDNLELLETTDFDFDFEGGNEKKKKNKGMKRKRLSKRILNKIGYEGFVDDYDDEDITGKEKQEEGGEASQRLRNSPTVIINGDEDRETQIRTTLKEVGKLLANHGIKRVSSSQEQLNIELREINKSDTVSRTRSVINIVF